MRWSILLLTMWAWYFYKGSLGQLMKFELFIGHPLVLKVPNHCALRPWGALMGP